MAIRYITTEIILLISLGVFSNLFCTLSQRLISTEKTLDAVNDASSTITTKNILPINKVYMSNMDRDFKAKYMPKTIMKEYKGFVTISRMISSMSVFVFSVSLCT